MQLPLQSFPGDNEETLLVLLGIRHRHREQHWLTVSRMPQSSQFWNLLLPCLTLRTLIESLPVDINQEGFDIS